MAAATTMAQRQVHRPAASAAAQALGRSSISSIGAALVALRRRAPLRSVVAFNNSKPSSAAPASEAAAALDADAAALRTALSSSFQYSVRRAARKQTGNPVTDLMHKLQLAWKIFFPDPPKDVTPKEEVKRRLRMVLVADRCGMNPASLSEMKRTIVRALQEFVDIEGEDGIEVSITSEPGLGAVYSVTIPVRRVKAEARFDANGIGMAEPAVMPDGVTLEWDPADYNSDPSSRFPMGC